MAAALDESHDRLLNNVCEKDENSNKGRALHQALGIEVGHQERERHVKRG